MIYIDDYTDALEFLEDAKCFNTEFTLTELRHLTSYHNEFEAMQLLDDLIWRYGYEKEDRRPETYYYKSNIYQYHKMPEEASYSKKALLLMEAGMYDIVDNYYKVKLEKERAELEQRKKDLGLE